MINAIKNRWHTRGGYREVLKIAIPLVLSTGSLSIQHFVDRMFLTWYSPEAIAAALPAGLINFSLMSIFIGTAAYVNTFVAQYYGAKRYERIGPAVWQGLYFALIAGLLVLPFHALADHIFSFGRHAPEVQILEVQYFRILLFCTFPLTAASALASFFAGRGKTWVVMWVNIISTASNIILDYGLIFGNWGLPELGMKGAAIATLLALCIRFILYAILICQKKYHQKYNVHIGYKWDPDLFKRLLKYGLPNGLTFCLDLIGFTIFVMIVGRFGTNPLAATNITFNINSLAFMPMMGFGMAVSILVGQHLGENRPEWAQQSAWSTFHLTFFYMGLIVLSYILAPRLFLIPYAFKADPENFPQIARLVVNLLKFVAAYAMFDTINIVFA
jgi:MATE family multidrug resistance protein